ncbi:MAG TPA: prepilin-type N-terminal cleavage/methylation domain-containing protein [Lacunisphaera sp.]|nr:prepilin-type N-terminal cleavage/methylation domain-containing protein [Lacunisphaera sp.]
MYPHIRSAPAAAGPGFPGSQSRLPGLRGLTLVEVMFALTIQAVVMLALIGSFIQSRRLTESTVLNAAATSLVYGLIEQMKELDYQNLIPNTDVDPSVPVDGSGNPTASPPYVRLRINQNKLVWIQCVYTPATESDPTPTPKGPTSTPSATATAADVGAIDNYIGSIPLSTVTGTASQQINLNIWLWVDEIPKSSDDVTDAKKVTMVYTYSYLDGNVTRVVRDREVFIRTRYEQ